MTQEINTRSRILQFKDVTRNLIFVFFSFSSPSSFIHIFPGVNNLSLIEVSFLFSVVLINIQRMISQEKAQKEFDESFVSLNY